MMRIAAIGLICVVLMAQEPPTFPVLRREVIVPALVTDRHGNVIKDLKPSDFRLYDNDKPQDIKQDIGYQPLSLVVAIQANNEVEEALPRVKKMAPLLKDLVAGQEGEVALLCFDHRIQHLQDFTNDGDKIKAALDKLKLGSSSSRLDDAVNEAARMLKNKKERRKVVLLVSEHRDISSEGKPREVMDNLQMWNVEVFHLNISTLVAKLTTKPGFPRSDPFPAASRPGPGGVVEDPTTVAQNSGAPGYSMEIEPLLEELYRGAVGIFIRNPARAFMKVTGGKEFTFVTQADLEHAVMSIGEDLHSQYLLSYSPNNQMEGGFHKIKVEVLKPGLKVTARQGYWMAAVPQ